ncbi:rod shape-determining protein MreC [Sphingomonas naasensis]|uniref:Cell shape-determining protein MreC n=1 Tax=Sphingomonas naasensis TaxID=1344951 RepID=A0A4S1WQG6_9SPHN|nr:rod shape-determining protein MreC [Sphingomonas naasensis]NIJ20202.1 rod shape-determining protein MreC [Sphingomonas naasensis]TGX44347.1 rod shape-determining protein MreC [Sphingomonas naasensis]
MAPPRNRRPGFSRRAQYGLFIGYVGAAAGALIGAVLLLLSTFNPPAFAAVRSVFAEVTTPVASGLDWVRRSLGSIPAGIGSYFAVHGENARLKKQIADDAIAVSRAQTLDQENRRLRALVKLRDVTTDAIVAARLVNSSSSSTRRFATLNAGSWQGVKRGQPVRDPTGLIGQVIETSPNSARVLLLVDPESIVPVRRSRDGLPAIASGRGDGLIDIRSASVASMGFRVGDAFVTSGTGGVFSPNIPVARVIRTQGDIAIAQPVANPDALDFALVQQTFLPEPTPTPSPSATASPQPAP